MSIAIWKKYLLNHFLNVFLLFLACFYGLYVLIDYATHTSSLIHQHMNWYEIIRYYLFIFSSRAEILIPVALLISCIKTCSTFNVHRELVAFMASGLSIRRFFTPLLALSTICIFLLYANQEWIVPHAVKRLLYWNQGMKHQKTRGLPSLQAQSLTLEDGSLFIFQEYNQTKNYFFDVYWIPSMDQIYKIKYLTPHLQTPKGEFVEQITRQPNGELLQKQAYPELDFTEMKFNKKILQSTLFDPDILPLSALMRESFTINAPISEKESKLLTAFYWKLATPWLCILAILIPAPYCTRFYRQYPGFFIYIGCLFGFIAFYMLIDATQVLAKRQVLSPFWAIVPPFLLSLSYFSYRFLRL